MTARIRILNAYSGVTYVDALSRIRECNLVIASAFGRSYSEIDFLRSIAEKNRKLTFLVGTQNCFTSPEFIEAGAKLAKELKNFDFIVDFRVPDSLHHKVVLATPSTVIIGSSNFTRKGLNGQTDLMGMLDDEEMFAGVKADLTRIKRLTGVLAAGSPGFNAALRRYKAAALAVSAVEHDKRVAGASTNPFKKDSAVSPTLTEWLSSDDAEPLRAFAYERDLDKQEREAATKVREKGQGVSMRGLTTYCPEGKVFDGFFLDVNCIGKKPKISVSKVIISGVFRGISVVLGKRQPIGALGFIATPEETEKLAALALKRSERWLSVAQMRKALGIPLSGARTAGDDL